MSISLRLILVCIAFLLLVVSPENLSRSALPHQTELLSPKEEDQLYSYLLRDKVDQIDSLLNRYSWFNGNIMVVKDHKILYQRSHGYANFQTREPLTTSSVFELASVSKQFTAVAILMLYERKLIDLDDEIKRYLPEITYKDITIRHLLNHTSGLPNYMYVLEKQSDGSHMPSNEEMLKILVGSNPNIFFKPGRLYSYSNTGYALLASVVERVSGKTFSQFIRENIFHPLEMHNTFTSVELLDNEFTVSHQAVGHRQVWRRFRPNTPVVHDRVLGDKGIHSCLEDLYKWDQALYSGQLVSKQSLEEAYNPVTLSNRRNFPYGFGFRIGKKSEEKYVYHHGLWEGFRTSFIRYIERGDAIVILNNTNQRFNNKIINNIEHIIEKPVVMSPTHKLALCVIHDGVPKALEMYNEMIASGMLQHPDANELFGVAQMLRQINKPVLSSWIYEFYETTSLCRDVELPLAGK
ncbi:MAG: beta-lactamase family protein [Bacteroidales bacterium]|nr:beta-lactamase family protein [Bacteroidales bacterium]